MLESGVSTPLKGIKKIAARRMVESWSAPAFSLSIDIDMSSVLATAKSLPGVTVTDLILKASSNALIACPELNAHFIDDTITTFSEVNIGLAVATPAGLTVPVIHNIHNLALDAVAASRKEIVERARTGKLVMADISGATFTISNLGMLGIDRFVALLNPPGVAILAVGSAIKKPIVVDDVVEIRPIASLTLTCDHRAVDGAAGALFLSNLRQTLLNSETLKE